jgi:hypothetical protein
VFCFYIPVSWLRWNWLCGLKAETKGESEMIGTLIGLILLCVVLGVVWWAAQQLLALVPLAEPFATIVRILLVVILVCIVVWVLITILGVAGIHVNTFGMH